MGIYTDIANEYAERERRNAQKAAEQIGGAMDQYGQTLEGINSGVTQAYDNAVAQQQASNIAQEKSFADLVAAMKADQNASLQEEDDRIARERKAAAWTGATELATAITNLIGVGAFNSSNQQYRNYSADWMKQADNDARRRLQRVDNIRDRQRQLQLQLSGLRAANANTLARTRIQAAGAQADMARQRAELAYKSAMAQAEAINAGEANASKMGMQAAQQDAAAAQRKQEIAAQNWRSQQQVEAQMALKGYRKGPDGNWQYDATLAAPTAANKDKRIAYNFKGTATDGTTETLYIDPEVLLENVKANSANFNDLPDDLQKDVDMIVANKIGSNAKEIADKLIAYIANSPNAMEMARRLSGGNVNDASSAIAGIEGEANDAQSAIDAIVGISPSETPAPSAPAPVTSTSSSDSEEKKAEKPKRVSYHDAVVAGRTGGQVNYVPTDSLEKAEERAQAVQRFVDNNRYQTDEELNEEMRRKYQKEYSRK